MKTTNKAVILYGPPGSGKGTQAQLLSQSMDMVHFDTGAFLRKTLYDPKNKNNAQIQKERKINESGKLNTPSWVLGFVSSGVKKIAAQGDSVILSGSPRTMFESFGDSRNQGLYSFLEKIYGRKNLHIFILKIPGKDSVKRNSMRKTCSVCKTPVLGIAKGARSLSQCTICGGKVVVRKDDKESVIRDRLREYDLRTSPIFTELKKRKYVVHEIDGRPMPYKVHEKIVSYLK